MSAASFNRFMGTKHLAATLHFVRGYDVFYDNTTTSDSIEVTLLQFATHQDAAYFKAGFVPGGPVSSQADAVIPRARDYDSTSPHQGTYDHGVIAVKGTWLSSSMMQPAAPPEYSWWARWHASSTPRSNLTGRLGPHTPGPGRGAVRQDHRCPGHRLGWPADRRRPDRRTALCRLAGDPYRDDLWRRTANH
jgi:hypothetical protein